MTTCCPTPCEKSNALTWLLCPNLLHVQTSVKVLGEEAQERKCSLAESILQHSNGEQCIQVLMQLLNSQDKWLCSVAVYIFGVLLENEDMVQKLQWWNQGSCSLCWNLGQLLEKDDPDVVLNAAGAIASLAETPSGRQWLLQDGAVFSQVLENVTCLLNHEKEKAVNSAALILAWLSLCETACQKLLSHSSASKILSHLAHCLTYSHKDTAMNAAFTIGRLCGTEQGRRVILTKAKEYGLASSLHTLLSNGAGPEAGQTACFALSCLASEDDGHTLLMESSSFPDLLNGLLSLLKSADPDSTWFAAMTVRVFVSRPLGVIQVRKHSFLEEQLKYLSLHPSTGLELQDEIDACLRKLRRLPKPLPITIQHLLSGACIATWEKQEPESGLEVKYSLFDGDTVVYRGLQCQVTLPHSHLRNKLSLCLRLNLSTSGGDVSPFSDPVEMTVERSILRPGTPQALHVTGYTDTQVHLSWVEPNRDVKPTSFNVYCDDVLVETTTKLRATVSCLSPSTTYTLSVCALGPGDAAGPCSSIVLQTDASYDHAPNCLTVAVLGRHELHISWGAPAVPLGRLFNYELRLNGFVVYLGTEKSHTARWLSANTAYTCTVTAITSRGRCQCRPITKRTAKNAYMNINRSLYSPSHQPIRHPVSPPVDREVNKVKTKARKSLLQKQLPNVQLTVPHHKGPDLRKDRHRLPFVSVPSYKNEKSQSNLRSEEQGPVRKLDVKAMWSRTRDGSDAVAFPVNASDCPMILRQEDHERTHEPQQLSDSPVDLTNCRSKMSPDLLLQWRSGRIGSDMGKLPLISQPITNTVRLLQPVSYHWPDLEQTEHHHNKAHRNRLAAGSRVNNQLNITVHHRGQNRRVFF